MIRHIRKIQTPSTMEAATEAIRDYLLENRLRVGDRLPTEKELASSLGISRNILREAIQHYRTLGIISTRPRVGTVIERLLPENPFAAYFPFIAVDPTAIGELAEIRLCLEVGAAELIIEKLTTEKLDELRELAQRMDGAGHEELNELDMTFHSTLLRIPGNRMLDCLVPLLVNFFQNEITPKERAEHDNVTAQHLKIVDALAAGNIPEYRALLKEHIDSYRHHKPKPVKKK